MTATDLAPVTRALISVSDKTGLVDLAKALADLNIEILSTGGSAKTISDAGIAVTEVADHTGFPEIMDGRVKTLHPKIHGGLLARRDLDDHQSAMGEHGIAPIDLLVVNLYPFESTVASGAGYDACVENIDIGGPAMIRAAAKNHDHVAVVVDTQDYAPLIEELKVNQGQVTRGLRQKLAANAYARTAAYDAAISTWFAQQLGDTFPRRMTFGGADPQIMRYGENPHQEAVFYRNGDDRPGVATARQIMGKELSFNNLNDTDAAFELAAELDGPGVAIIKHANPCGVAVADDLVTAYRKALASDPMSAYGGIVAVNQALDGATATEIAKLFAEVVIAPDADDAALEAFSSKKAMRLLLTGGMPDPLAPGLNIRNLAGGYLVQGRDNGRVTADDLKIVTKRQPSQQELADMLLAFRICKHVKSNAIIYVKDGATVGIGAGQMSRVDSARIAAIKSKEAGTAAGESEVRTIGSAVASDAFFPFADGLLTAAEAGATAVIQPGGSMRDDEIIAAADEAGLTMALTGMRHFRH